MTIKDLRLRQRFDRLWPADKRKYPKWLNLALAFLLPFLGFCLVMIMGALEPFGNEKAILYSDQYHQYYPFFLAFRRNLLNGDSLLFSWDVGMGMDYLGLMSYYLASPLNLLSVLVPESMMLEYFAILTPIRLGLAGLFFALFLKHTFKVEDFSIAVFGAFYGLCAWALGYQWNVMWLDTFALLPLVALGMVKLLRDKKPMLYTISLFLSIFANYYIGFFTCIFVLLSFCCYQICRAESFKTLAQDLGRIALFSILAIGMTAILELPTLAAMQNTQSSVNQYPDGFAMNILSREECADAIAAWDAFKNAGETGAAFFSRMGLWFKAMWESLGPVTEGMRQVAGNISGTMTITFKEGLPNLYCGISTVIFSALFLTSGQIKLRDKICAVSMLVFMILSFLLRQLDYIWHGFHFTNMIPYRFSFLFSFVMLYMAYRAWMVRSSFKLWQIIVAALLSLTVMVCSKSWNEPIFFTFQLVFMVLYLGVVLFVIIEQMLPPVESEELVDPTDENTAQILKLRKEAQLKRRTRQAGFVLCGVMCIELLLNLLNFGTQFTPTTVTGYPKGGEGSAAIMDYLNEKKEYSDFFRTEMSHAQTLNDGALNGYYGISTFTSSANVRVTEFMRALGYGAKNTYNRYCFEEASPVSNLFLNLRYMVERDGNKMDDSFMKIIWNNDGVILRENQYYLPLGFLAESSLAESTIPQLDREDEVIINLNNFDKQNYLFQIATGIETPVWTEMTSEDVKITASSSVTLNKVIGPSYAKYTTGSNGGRVYYTYTVDTEGFMCLDMNLYKRNGLYVFKNGQRLYYESMSLPQMLAVSEVKPGDTIKVEVICSANDTGVVSMWPAILSKAVFEQGYDILSSSTLDLTHFSNTRVEGTIDCNRDGLLYTSIPYDGNWVAEVDGKPAEIVLVGDAMCALNLTKGAHTVVFRYENKAFKLGSVISVVSLLTFVAVLTVPKLLKRRKGKFEK